MDREEAIKILKAAETDHFPYEPEKLAEAFELAIASLETDEAYQLEYEVSTQPSIEDFIEYAERKFGVKVSVKKSDNPDTFEKLFGRCEAEDCISRAEVLKLMQDNWHTHSGDWAMQESLDDIRALPSLTLQEPFIKKPCVSSGVCEHDKNKVLNKIRAEVKRLQKMCDKNDLNLMAQYSAFGMVLDIFDKYKAEIEPQERSDKE